jgi:hypothetical protein
MSKTITTTAKMINQMFWGSSLLGLSGGGASCDDPTLGCTCIVFFNDIIILLHFPTHATFFARAKDCHAFIGATNLLLLYGD